MTAPVRYNIGIRISGRSAQAHTSAHAHEPHISAIFPLVRTPPDQSPGPLCVSQLPTSPTCTRGRGDTAAAAAFSLIGLLAPGPDAGRRSIRSLGEPGQQPPPPSLGVVTSPAPPPPPPPDGERRGHDGEAGEEAFEHDLPDAIKLGLGDFIFYSLLVGRAAMYDFMTVFSSYLAIIAGLGLTLLCLAIYQKALPALPFSIAMGVAFYFLTRFTLEPFLVPMAAHLAYY
ncbi:hypothetical protein Vretimale_11218 [Volvox reticuliferus]|uniref:Presenilin n=1 Tax=Volvox reticuliferus TaxID=1737510 RepID=A0A8J4GH95_9CHLO|nr:hypothetical protein Vretimale_11218 [Volvox reticuliferus]